VQKVQQRREEQKIRRAEHFKEQSKVLSRAEQLGEQRGEKRR
jgi:hypothetical protein